VSNRVTKSKFQKTGVFCQKSGLDQEISFVKSDEKKYQPFSLEQKKLSFVQILVAFSTYYREAVKILEG
jgi:hypothetical protein